MNNCFTQYVSPIRGLSKQYITRAPRLLLRIYSYGELPMCELIDLTCGIVSAALSLTKPLCEIVVSFPRMAELYYDAYNDNRTIQTSCR